MSRQSDVPECAMLASHRVGLYLEQRPVPAIQSQPLHTRRVRGRRVPGT